MQASMMRYGKMIVAAGLSVALSSAALASDARTSASATGGGLRPGSAAASASYQGDTGFARTQTRTGEINASRAVAVGVDEQGLSLSISHALAPQFGPAVATNFNLTIGSDGQVATSVGTTVARGGLERTAQVSGNATSTRIGSTAGSVATGRTIGGGVVRSNVRAESYPRPIVRRVVRLP